MQPTALQAARTRCIAAYSIETAATAAPPAAVELLPVFGDGGAAAAAAAAAAAGKPQPSSACRIASPRWAGSTAASALGGPRRLTPELLSFQGAELLLQDGGVCWMN